jgi:hypothetical protein
VLRACAGVAGARLGTGRVRPPGGGQDTRHRPDIRGCGTPARGPAILCGVTNRAATALRLSAAAAASLLVSACGVFSPVQTDEPYIPADGVPLSIPGLELRNLAIVTATEGGPGVVVGQVVNDTGSSVDVTFGLQGGPSATGSSTVPAYSGDTITDSTEQVQLPSVPAKPGAMAWLTVTTTEAGENVVQVPVLLDNRFYTGLLGGA